LTPEQEAKLDRLAELAQQNPDILAAIQNKIDDEARLEIFCLSHPEVKALAKRTGLKA
jgi:hypothetical protein